MHFKIEISPSVTLLHYISMRDTPSPHNTILRPHFTFTLILHVFSGQGLHSEILI